MDGGVVRSGVRFVFFGLAGLGSVASAVAGRPDGGNRLPNPGFESGAAVPDRWERFEPAGARVTRDASVARSGQASGRIASDAEGAKEYPCFRFRLGEVAVGEEYEGSAWACTRGATELGGYVVVEFWAGERRLCFVQSAFTGSGDHDWTSLHARAMVPEGADTVAIGLVAHGEGEVWFDEAQLVRTLTAPKPFTGTEVRLQLRPGTALCPRLDGFGAQGDYLLTRQINTDRGVNDQDRAVVLQRVAAMRPHLIRTFFDYQWWEPEEGRTTPDSEAMRDYVAWVRFLRGIGTSVLLTPWGDHFAYPGWMRDGTSRLPQPAKREAMVRSLVDVVSYLRRDEGLDNVRYLCLMNEPDSDFLRDVPVDEYVRLNALLDRLLRERGLREEITLLGADECQSGPSEVSPWFRDCVSQGLSLWDGLSVHTYRHQYVPNLVPWLGERRGLLRGSGKPLLITEFGYGGETYRNWENDKYEYGLFLADFAVTALREGASAALMWCLGDTYYTADLRQEYGLWRYKDGGWEPRPGFYAWSLVTRYTRPGSRVVAVAGEPEAPDVRAVALAAPTGEVSVLLVNRYSRSVEATLGLGLRRPATLRAYRYTREAVPTADRGMIGASDTFATRARERLRLELPAESFTLLTEVE